MNRSPAFGAGRRALGRVIANARGHRWHVLLGAATLGLAAGPRAPLPVLLAAALVTAVISPTRAHRALCVAALLAGAAFADARLAALDRAAAPAVSSETLLVRGFLLESPRATASGWRALAQVPGRKLLVRVRGAAPAWSAGDGIRAAGRMRELGERDDWLRPRHVGVVLEARRVRLTGRRRGGITGAIDDVRRRATNAITKRMPPPEAGLLRGMTLGDEAGLPRDSLDQLRAAGLGHVVAASGQNVALLALLVQALGALIGLSWRARLLLTLALVALYVPLAGGGPSILRAGVMGAAIVIAALAARPSARWHALLLAAAVTLALDPASLEQPGWQLSFAAVAAIGMLCEPLTTALRSRGLPRPLAASIAITLAATIGTAPVSAAVFGNVSLAGLAANVIVAPVVAPITWLGMIAASVAQLSPSVGAVVAAPAGPMLAFVLGVARGLGGLDVAQVSVSAPLATLLCASAALIIGSASVRRVIVARARSLAGASQREAAGGRQAPRRGSWALRIALGALIALGLVTAIVPGRSPPPGQAPLAAGVLRISFLDIGQGDATLLQAGPSTLLVDAGPPNGKVLDELRAAGVRRVSAMVATHAQADHIGGAGDVLRSLSVGLLVDGRDGVAETHGRAMAAAADARHVRSAAPRAGDRLRVPGMQVDVLWPPARPPGASVEGDPNDRAVVLVVRAAGVRVLLTADAESGVLSRLDLPVVDVLKVSHHGSADPGLPALLRRLRPRVAVIEVGAGNTYGHPVPATLAALRASGARVLRTDRDGTVVLEARRGRLSLRPEP